LRNLGDHGATRTNMQKAIAMLDGVARAPERWTREKHNGVLAPGPDAVRLACTRLAVLAPHS
jgi:hypothetical protein